MADSKARPKKDDTSLRDGSESTVGPGPGSSVSNRSSMVHAVSDVALRGYGAIPNSIEPQSTPQPRKSSLGQRDPYSTLSYVPSELDVSAASATEMSSEEDDGGVSRTDTAPRPGQGRGRAGTQGSIRWTDVSQGSVAPSAGNPSKGKRRASASRRPDRTLNERDTSSRSRRRSRDTSARPEDEDEEDDDGRFGPLDDEDDEVHHIDRGELLVRRRMKARQKELALRKKAEKEKEKQQQIERIQQATTQQLSPRLRPLSRQGAISPVPHLDRESRPMHINVPPPNPNSTAVTSPTGPVSPGVRGAMNYPSPHSHIRRPSARQSSYMDGNTGGRRTSLSSAGLNTSTVAPYPAQAAAAPMTPNLPLSRDVFTEQAISEADTASSRPDRASMRVMDDDDEADDEVRDTVPGLARDLGTIRSDREPMEHDDLDPAENDDAESPDGDENSGDTLDEDGSDRDVEYTLKDRQDAINIEHPFGLPIWKPALYKKSRSVTRNAEIALHSIPSAAAERHLLPVNLLWTMCAGLWLSLVCYALAILVNFLPLGGSRYARVIWELAGYLFWPFGKYIEVEADPRGTERHAQPHDKKEQGDIENGLSTMEEEGTYENSFTPVAARFPHDHKHTVPFNSRATSHNLELSRNDTIRPGDTIAAYQVLDDQNRSSGSGSSGGAGQGGDKTAHTPPTKPNDHGSYGALKFDSLEDNAVPYTEAERIRQEAEIYGYVEDDAGHDVGRLARLPGTIAYGVAFWLVIAPLMTIICLACWGLVFPIPMAKLTWVLLRSLASRPLALRFRSAPRIDSRANDADENTPLLGHKRSILQQLKAGEPAPQTAKQSSDGRLFRQSRILICTYRAMGLQYYKYTVGGVNILFINTLPFVFFTILDFFFIEPYVEHHHIKSGLLALISSKSSMFVFALGSVIPLSYFIGMAVASISAQSSIGMGAVINATFGSIIEIILYAIALTQDKARLVEGSIVGSILAGVLLMPGVSMCSGAMRRKEQRFNARSAGVTSTMLIMAIIGILTPTLFYQIYGTFQLTCNGCPTDSPAGDTWTCKRCFYEHVPPATDPFYQENVKGLMYTCTIVLVLSYGIGLWFSLRTHASQIWQNAQPQPSTLLSSGAEAHAHGALSGHAYHAAHPGAVNQVNAGSMPISGMPVNQANPRNSVYRRLLPAGIAQQLLPGSQRHTSGQSQTVRSNQSRSAGERRADDREWSAGSGQPPPPLQLPETMSAEEYERNYGPSGPPNHARQTGSVTSQGQIRRLSYLTSTDHTRQGSHLLHHAHQASQPHGHASQPPGAVESAEGGHGGHDAPSWTRTTSLIVLISCTVLYAIIAEILVDAVDEVLDGSGLDLKLLGVTLFALVPNATEFMNAMSFAINGNIALSMEIGSAYALQVCLIQIPAMVVFSAFYQAHHSHDNDINSTFTLIFPRWDVIAIIFSIFLLTYTYIESRSNYFRGSLCILSYCVLISGFVFAPNTGDPEDPVEDHPALALVSKIFTGSVLDTHPATSFIAQTQAMFYSLWTR